MRHGYFNSASYTTNGYPSNGYRNHLQQKSHHPTYGASRPNGHSSAAANTEGLGTGLQNLGNTCFMNSVIQCLVHTPHLHHYLKKGQHGQKCTKPSGQFCAACALEQLVDRAFPQGASAFAPSTIAHNLSLIAKGFRLGRQEDAHEFMRYLAENLTKNLPLMKDRPPSDDPKARYTIMQKVFQGQLQSQVRCLHCKHDSNTFDPFLDLSLELTGGGGGGGGGGVCQSLDAAMRLFTQEEFLERENRYKCEKCKQLVRARKQFTVRVAPRQLTVQLKRFTFGAGGFYGYGGGSGKISSHVAFEPTWDITRFSTAYQQNPAAAPSWRYALYAVLVHEGGSTSSGHYYCYVRPVGAAARGGRPTGWFCMNDSSVSQVSEREVLQAHAYMLFYELVSDPPPPPAVPNSPGGSLNGSPRFGPQGRPADVPHMRLPHAANGHANGRAPRAVEPRPALAAGPRLAAGLSATAPLAADGNGLMHGNGHAHSNGHAPAFIGPEMPGAPQPQIGPQLPPHLQATQAAEPDASPPGASSDAGGGGGGWSGWVEVPRAAPVTAPARPLKPDGRNGAQPSPQSSPHAPASPVVAGPQPRPPPPPPPGRGADGDVLRKGDEVFYVASDGSRQPAVVAQVHTDDVPPYYTVRVDGQERGTVRSRLLTHAQAGTSGVAEGRGEGAAADAAPAPAPPSAPAPAPALAPASRKRSWDAMVRDVCAKDLPAPLQGCGEARAVLANMADLLHDALCKDADGWRSKCARRASELAHAGAAAAPESLGAQLKRDVPVTEVLQELKRNEVDLAEMIETLEEELEPLLLQALLQGGR